MSSPTLHATQYIVKLKDHVDMDDHIQLFDSTYNRSNESPHKVTHKWAPDFANAYVGEFSAEVLANLKKHENVEYISENIRMTADDRCDITKQEDAGWGLSRINREDKLPDGSKPESVNYKYKYDASYETGSRVDIYVLDSGEIYIKHNDFGGRAVWGHTVQQQNGDGTTVTDDDCDGHGTHVAGIAGGKRWGVAKDVTLIAVKYEDDAGHASVQDHVDGMEWILRQFKSSKRPSIVNMSHGTPRRNRFWNEIATKLVKNGMHVVVAAGNKNWDARNTSPASAALVNTVGATNIKDERYTMEHKKKDTTGSNYGPCVDFFAPGQDITSCGLYKDKEDRTKKDPDATDVKTGTSMSAPVVSGIIATFISLNGDRPPLMMTNILRTLCVRQGVVSSSIPDPNTTRALIQGALHVEAAFSLKAQSGTLRLVEATPVFDLSTIRRPIGTMPDHGIGGITNTNKLRKDDGSASIRKKLENISIFSRGILSKVEEGTEVYNANVSVFDAVKIECNFNDGVCYDCTIPFMIVGTYPAIDVAVGHARDAEDDSEAEDDAEAYATVTFNKTSYVNDKLLTYDEGSEKGEYPRYLNEVIFKACLLRAIT